jgi:hypothetical protein
MAQPLAQTNDEDQWIARELCKIRFQSNPQTFYVTLKQVLIQMCPDRETESDEETDTSESEGEKSEFDEETVPKTTSPSRKRTAPQKTTEPISPLPKRPCSLPRSLLFQGSPTESHNREIRMIFNKFIN